MRQGVAYGLPTTNEQNVAAKANQLANFPLNFLRTGYYNDADGKVHRRTAHGRWWSSTQSSAARTNDLNTDTVGIYPHWMDVRGLGFALRWGDFGFIQRAGNMW